jgi:hypothetical protein
MPGVGKSSLLTQLEKSSSSNKYYIINLDDIRNKNSFWNAFIKVLAESNDRNIDDPPDPSCGSFGKALDKLKDEEEKSKVIFLLDNLESLISNPDADWIIAAFKEVFQLRNDKPINGEPSFALIITLRPGAFLRPEVSESVNEICEYFTETLWLAPLPDDKTKKLIKELCKDNDIEMTKETPKRIVQLSGGLPRLVKLLVLSTRNSGELPDFEHREDFKWLHECFKKNHGDFPEVDLEADVPVLADIWTDLDIDNHRIICEIAQDRALDQRISRDPNRDRNWFLNIGILDNREHLFSDLFRKYILETKKCHAIWGSATNHIKNSTKKIFQQIEKFPGFTLLIFSLLFFLLFVMFLHLWPLSTLAVQLGLSLILGASAVILLTSMKWWPGEGRLGRLVILWGCLLTLYLFLSLGLLTRFYDSWWFFPSGLITILIGTIFLRLIIEISDEGLYK